MKHLKAPQAAIKPRILREFNNLRIDNYYWLKDKAEAEVIDYLTAENSYSEAVMADSAELQEKIYSEILGRIKEDDESYPLFIDGYWYFSRSIKGKDYGVYLRKKGSLAAAEEIIFDVNSLAQGHSAYIFADYEISPNNQLAAYLFNTSGSYAEFILKVKDLTVAADLEFSVEKVASVAWAADNETLFYTVIDDTLRSSKVFCQNINGGDAKLIYEETDATFSVSVGASKTKEHIIIFSSSHTASEVRLLPTDLSTFIPQLVLARQKKVEYSLYEHPDYFYLYYKDEQQFNGALYRVAKDKLYQRSSWQLIVAHDPDVMLDGLCVLQDYLVVQQKTQALNNIRVLDLAGGLVQSIEFPEPVYQAELLGNPHLSAVTFRYNYSSLNRPPCLFEYDIEKNQTVKLKQRQIPAGFEPQNYEVKRLWATAADGAAVPIAVVHKKGLVLNGRNNCLLYGYGSYGSNTEAYFRSSYFSLIDRGFVFAIAQVRGGSEMGEQWYLNGKFLHKKNTFTDFIAAARTLVDAQYTAPQQLTITGGSAGGLLVAAVLNMCPQLFHCAVAHVPFVDVLTTMLDASLPLTVGEYEEWGNPQQKEYYDYILSYSPYDNVKAQNYPHILVTAGLNDSQVLFHEPAKWVAKLRALKTDNNLLLLKTNMDSGHGGATGKYAAIRELAFEMAFILKCATIKI